MRFLKLRKLQLLLLLAAILTWGGGVYLISLDDSNFRLEDIANRQGGKVVRTTESRVWGTSWLPSCALTKWLRPVTEIDFSNTGLNDETMYWICRNGFHLEQIVIDGNPEVSDESVVHINKLSNVKSLSIQGTSINSDLISIATKPNYNASDYMQIVFILGFLLTLLSFAFSIVKRDG